MVATPHAQTFNAAAAAAAGQAVNATKPWCLDDRQAQVLLTDSVSARMRNRHCSGGLDES